MEASQLREQLTETRLRLLERDSEVLQLRRSAQLQQGDAAATAATAEVRAHVKKQEAQVRALRAQLADFLAIADEQRGAAEAREEQLEDLTRALARAHDRDAAAMAALEEHARNTAALRLQLEDAHGEVDRMRSTIDVLSKRHESLTDECDALRRAREADGAALDAARTAMREAAAARTALAAARAEEAALVSELEKTRRRAAALAAQNDERRLRLLAMQSDLDAALAGGGGGGGGRRAPLATSSAGGGRHDIAALLEPRPDDTMDANFVTDDDSDDIPAPAVAKRSRAMGVVGGVGSDLTASPRLVGGVAAPLAMGGGRVTDDATRHLDERRGGRGRGSNDASGEAAVALPPPLLRARLRAAEDRCAALESDATELLAVNAQLRAVLSEALRAGGSDDRSAPVAAAAPIAADALAAHALECDGALDALATLCRESSALHGAVTEQLLRAEAEGGGDSGAAALPLPHAAAAVPRRVPAAVRFGAAAAAQLNGVLRDRGWLEPAALREAAAAQASDAARLAAAIRAHAALRAGRECALQ